MIEKIISWSIDNRFFVWIGILIIIIGGIYSVMNTPVDAIPDLSENQVIVYTEWMGRNPQIIEDQITRFLVQIREKWRFALKLFVNEYIIYL